MLDSSPSDTDGSSRGIRPACGPSPYGWKRLNAECVCAPDASLSRPSTNSTRWILHISALPLDGSHREQATEIRITTFSTGRSWAARSKSRRRHVRRSRVGVVVAVSEPDGLKIGRLEIDGGSTSLAFLSPRLVLSNKRRLSVASCSAGKNGGRPGEPIPARAVVGRRSDRTLHRSRKTLRGVLSRHTLIDNKGRAAASTNFSRPRARIQRSFFEHALRAACIRYKRYVFATTAGRRAGRRPISEVRGVPRTAGTPRISRRF